MLDEYDSEKHKEFIFRPNCIHEDTSAEWKPPTALKLATFWNLGNQCLKFSNNLEAYHLVLK